MASTWLPILWCRSHRGRHQGNGVLLLLLRESLQRLLQGLDLLLLPGDLDRSWPNPLGWFQHGAGNQVLTMFNDMDLIWCHGCHVIVQWVLFVSHGFGGFNMLKQWFIKDIMWLNGWQRHRGPGHILTRNLAIISLGHPGGNPWKPLCQRIHGCFVKWLHFKDYNR